MDFDFARLLTSEYFLDSDPGGDFMLGYALLLFFLGLAFLPSFLKKSAAQNKSLKKSMKNRLGKFIFLGVIGLILVAARFSGVPGFSMRMWLYLVFVGALIAIVYTSIRVSKDYKKRLDSIEREAKKQKI